MIKKVLLNKGLVIVVLVLFVGAGISPASSEIIEDDQDISSLTFYTFGRTGTNKCKVELTADLAEEISSLFGDLKDKITCDPLSDQTIELKNDFVDLLDANGLIPVGLSRDYVFSLLSPRWLNWFGGDSPFSRNIFLSSLDSRLKNSFVPGSFSNTGSAFFCSMAGGGFGLLFPPIMIPRPRIATVWSSFLNADTIAANLYTGHGFSASGSQFGVALGFLGVGLSFAIPGQPAYFAFGGYSLFTMVGADEVVTYPLNNEPIISEEIPADGKWNVPLSLSELSFKISDADGDRMDYWVTTDPDIGSDSGFNKRDGRYSVSVSGLEYDTSYRWTVKVSDGKSEVEKTFSFFSVEGPPLDPFDEGWQYRKKITIDHSQVAGDISDFPVLVNVVDSDLKNKVQSDGDDILFMDGPGVANKLSHEIERFNGNSGTLTAWINVPTLSSSSDTEFYMYYGNPGCNNQENVYRVWNGGFEAVYHMSDVGNQIDSTINGHTLSPVNAPDYQQTGKIGYCCYFDSPQNEYFQGNAPLTSYPCTIELYYKRDGAVITGFYHCMANIASADTKNVFSCVTLDDSNYYQAQSKAGAGNYDSAKTTNSFTSTNWNYIVARHASSSSRMVKANDIYEGKNTASLNPYNIDIITIGCIKNGGGSGTYWSDGWIDEVRVSNVFLSDDWTTTSYNSLENGYDGGFFSLGPEETGP